MTEPKKPEAEAPEDAVRPEDAGADPDTETPDAKPEDDAGEATASDDPHEEDTPEPGDPDANDTPDEVHALTDETSTSDEAASQGEDRTDAVDASDTEVGTDFPADGDAAPPSDTIDGEMIASHTADSDGIDGDMGEPVDGREGAGIDLAEEALRDAETRPEAMAMATAGGAAAAGMTSGKSGMEAGAAPDPAPKPEPAPVQTVVEKRGGVVPGFFGGVVAVAGAAIALPYVLPENMRPVTSLAPVEEQIVSQLSEMEALGGRIDEVAAAAEGALSADALAPVADSVAALEQDMEARLAELTAQNADLGARIEALVARNEELVALVDEVQRSPLEDSTDPAVVAALSAYEDDVEELRSVVAAQTEEMRAAVAAQTEENARLIEEAAVATRAAQEAAAAEAAAAEERAEQAARQQALIAVQAALESGQPFADALAGLDEVDVPEALTAVAGSGVATLAALQADFAEPAREALEAARRSDMPDDPASRGLSFLKTQLGMRSLAPMEGDDPDAILSRAEAALREGDLAASLAELEAMPEAGQAPLSDWIARTRSRVDALAAADALAQAVATN